MKKFIYGIIFMLMFSVPTFASWDVKTEAQLQERMNYVGFNILNSNRIEHRMIFGLM